MGHRATKPAFRTAFADGYYEWLRQGKTKLPHLYEVDSGTPFALAGPWEWWRLTGADGEGLESLLAHHDRRKRTAGPDP